MVKAALECRAVKVWQRTSVQAMPHWLREFSGNILVSRKMRQSCWHFLLPLASGLRLAAPTLARPRCASPRLAAVEQPPSAFPAPAAASVPPPSPAEPAASGAQQQANQAGEAALSVLSGLGEKLSAAGEATRSMPVEVSLQRLQRDMAMLDQAAGARPQVSQTSFLALSLTVLVAGVAPLGLSEKLVEVLVPSMSAISAAIGLSAEFNGKVEVARGKEIAAVTLQAAAEAESYLAQAERAKAIVPLCVGIATTFSAFALLAPAFVAELAPKVGPL